jgi:hypothetical protein
MITDVSDVDAPGGGPDPLGVRARPSTTECALLLGAIVVVLVLVALCVAGYRHWAGQHGCGSQFAGSASSCLQAGRS